MSVGLFGNSWEKQGKKQEPEDEVPVSRGSDKAAVWLNWKPPPAPAE